MLSVVLVCGDRNWTNKDKIREVIIKHTPSLIIHGGCRGADTLAGEVAKELGIPVKVFPAEWDKYGKAAGPIRNQKMLDEGKPDLVIAFHNNIENSRGTKDMLYRAAKHAIPTILYTEV